MSDKFENPQDSHDSYESHNFSRLPKDVEILKAVHQGWDDVWKDCEKIHEIHRLEKNQERWEEGSKLDWSKEKKNVPTDEQTNWHLDFDITTQLFTSEHPNGNIDNPYQGIPPLFLDFLDLPFRNFKAS